MVGIIVGAVVVGIIVGIFFYRRRKKQRGANSQSAMHFTVVSATSKSPVEMSDVELGEQQAVRPTPQVSTVSSESIELSATASESMHLKMSKAQQLLQAWQVDASEILMGDQLGEGGQAIVSVGHWRGIQVAIKAPKRGKELTQKSSRRRSSSEAGNNKAMDSFKQALRREVRALSRVRHPNVVRLIGACFEPTPMVLMAFAPSGTLQDALDDHRFQTNHEVVLLLAGIARGMEAVHAHKILHLDLKPENVLIGPNDVPWITDFGLSTSSNKTSMSQSSAGGRGTLPFKGPEMFTNPPKPSAPTDVYAFAILGWIVVTGEDPYQEIISAMTSLGPAVLDGKRPSLADGDDWKDRTTGTIAKLIEACWAGEMGARPTFGPDGTDAGTGIVKTLEKLETSMAKASDEEGEDKIVARLITCQAGVDESTDYIAEIDDAIGESATIKTEADELKLERQSATVNSLMVQKNVDSAKEQLSKVDGGNDLATVMMEMMRAMKNEMAQLKEGVVDKIKSHELSLTTLSTGELDCPRLFVMLPEAKSEGCSKFQRLRAKHFLKDRYRLAFLDPVTGMATKCGKDGKGYELEVPKKWLVDNRKYINDGLKVVKLAAAAGRIAGLPIPSSGLPSSIVSQAELSAVNNFERLMATSSSVELNRPSSSEGGSTQAATGDAYKALRKMLREQCGDQDLIYCHMQKMVRASPRSRLFP